MSDRNVHVAILILSDESGHSVEISIDGHRTKTYGPFDDRDVALLIANEVGDMAREIAAKHASTQPRAKQ